MGSLIAEFETPLWHQGYDVLGIDEAGRGPMAGPCVVTGVVFPKGFYHPDINDSKKMSAKKRDQLVSLITDNAQWIKTVIVDVETIDRDNIYRATQFAMETIAKCAPEAMVLTDAMPLVGVDKAFEAVIKGDMRSMTIAAASIIAKTTRDAIMMTIDAAYPMYGFKNHKGYGTKAHREAIMKYGRCEHHRQTFKFKEEDKFR